KVALARVQVRTYMMDLEDKTTYVYVLEGGEGGKDGKDGPDKMKSSVAYPPSMTGKTLNQNLFGSMAAKGKGGGTTHGNIFTRGTKNKHKDLLTAPEDVFSKESRVGKKLKQTRIDKVKEGEALATQVQPVRMAIVAASFPYKKQVEEF